MKPTIKFCGLLLGIFLLGVIGYLGFFWKDVSAFRLVLAGYHSHLYCSCRYVTKQSEDVCLDFARQYIDVEDFRDDPVQKEVYTKALGIEATARFVNADEGCILNKP